MTIKSKRTDFFQLSLLFVSATLFAFGWAACDIRAQTSVRVNATTPQSARQARREIAKFRATRDAEFRNQGKSPLEAEDFAHFRGLVYFPIDLSYRVTARFVRTADEKEFAMPSSRTGTQKPFVKYGELRFVLDGAQYTLNVYQSPLLMREKEYADYLFAPFTDATSGKETYGGGRYIDLHIPSGATLILDFNQAYQPNCAYNHSGKYACPIPPRENRLAIAVRVGEKEWR